jgi:hypothetical protein
MLEVSSMDVDDGGRLQASVHSTLSGSIEPLIHFTGIDRPNED